MTVFDGLLFLVAAVAGAIASVSGFGVGSLLTPALALQSDTRTAVACVAIPHVIATAVRFWQMRRHVDWAVVRSFGITSAAGGLGGALLHGSLRSPALTAVFAALLIFAGLLGVTGLQKRLRFTGRGAWAAGALSGMFGGLVGNQGGIRSAAMMGFDLRRDAFVATATTIALFVDGARLPAYLVTDREAMARFAPQILAATAGVLLGTGLGVRILSRIPERIFGKVVSAVILALGAWMACRAWIEVSPSARS